MWCIVIQRSQQDNKGAQKKIISRGASWTALKRHELIIYSLALSSIHSRFINTTGTTPKLPLTQPFFTLVTGYIHLDVLISTSLAFFVRYPYYYRQPSSTIVISYNNISTYLRQITCHTSVQWNLPFNLMLAVFFFYHRKYSNLPLDFARTRPEIVVAEKSRFETA